MQGHVTTLGSPVLRKLSLSERAARLWADFCNEVERAQAPGGRYAKMKASAGRAAEKALRIAGVLELFYAPSASTVTELNMRRGVSIAQWYLDEARRIFECAEAADEVTDADDILSWARRSKHVKDGAFNLRDVINNGPRHLRPKGQDAARTRQRLRTALDWAIDSAACIWPGMRRGSRGWRKNARTSRVYAVSCLIRKFCCTCCTRAARACASVFCEEF